MAKENKKKRSSLLRRLFLGGRAEELDIFAEEQVQSPIRTIIKNFMANKLAMGALILFLAIFLFVFIGPAFFPMDLSYSDSTQVNIAPGLDMMDVPKELKGNLKDIGISSVFSVGLSNDGDVYTWGKTKITKAIDVKEIPKDVQSANIVDVAVGTDHIAVLTDRGNVLAWGNNRLMQADVPYEAASRNNIVYIEAGNQTTAAITKDGELILWGNAGVVDLEINKDYQGKFKKVAFTSFAYVSLLNDGSVVYAGAKQNALSTIPAGLESGVVDIATTGFAAAALKEDGTIVVWGNVAAGEADIPKFSSKPVSIVGGRYHFTVLCEDGSVVSWGKNNFGQTEVSKKISNDAVAVYAGSYQNYALTKDGDIETWGLKGYVFGTDELGRDILTRLVNGGKMTMTVGGVAVIISTVIGIIIGGVCGYFGGKVDMFLMRITEIIESLPFLPFAMILSSIIGSRLPENQRIYLIMIVLGLLSWSGLARLVRAQVLAEREKEFVIAATAVGIKQRKIVFRHIVPNVISTIIVSATLSFATCMLTESSLSYLGFGVALPRPTWGNMLTGANNSTVIQYYWWRWVFASVILSICTICINTIGDGLRDAIDPKSNER